LHVLAIVKKVSPACASLAAKLLSPMPLEVLAIMVVAGLAFAIGAVHFTGASRPARVEDAEQAAARFTEDFPDCVPANCVITKDERAAFLELEPGRIGLVAAIGAKFITRIIGEEELKKLDEDKPGELVMRFRDFTYPAGRYRFNNEDDAQRVVAWLGGAKAGGKP
jgi:hypothetical protein